MSRNEQKGEKGSKKEHEGAKMIKKKDTRMRLAEISCKNLRGGPDKTSKLVLTKICKKEQKYAKISKN